MDVAPDPAADPDVETQPRGGFRCRLCQISVANRPSLAAHLGGKRHVRLRGLRASRREQERRSLFVSGFARGTDTDDLARHFQTFGDVAAVVMDKEKGVYAIVELREASGRDRALAEPHHLLHGHRLRVRPRQEKTFAGRTPGRGPRRSPPTSDRLEETLCREDDVEAQMKRLVELLELSESERHLRHLLLSLFQEVFSEFFPGCSVVPFGSSVNGFDAHGCDLDLFLDLEATKSTQTSSGGFSGEESILSDLDLASAPPTEVLEVVGLVLRRCVPGVGRVQALPAARRPVVKFQHKPSGLEGDVSVDNRLGLLNTRFLRLCSESDERVRPLIYTLRLWAKRQGLAGNPSGGGAGLTNYALTLLALFFLQTRSPPVLPSVSRLRELAGDDTREVVDGWDCTFPHDSDIIQPSDNSERPASLLVGFFQTFSDFDFANNLLSVREGRALPLPLPSGSSIPDLKFGPFNLQDPFELSHNVAANVSARMVVRFQSCCRQAAKYGRSLQFRHKSKKGKVWGIARLLQPGEGQPPGAAAAGPFVIAISLDAGGGSEQPEVGSERPEVGSEHPNGSEWPEVGSERPNVGSEQPEVGSEHPNGSEWPEVGSERPNVGSEQPDVGSEHPNGSEWPNVGSKHPNIGSKNPSVGSEHPKVGSEHPNGSEQPDVGSKQPDVGSEHPNMGSKHPKVGSKHPNGSKWPNIGSEHPDLGSEHPNGSEQPDVGSKHPKVGSEHPDVGSKHPNGSEWPHIGSEHPDVSSKWPDVGSEHPDVGSERPDVGSEHPNGSEWPDVGSEHPDVGSEHPNGSKWPDVSSEHPKVRSEHPGVDSEHPNVDSEHSNITSEPPGGPWFGAACSSITFVLRDVLQCSCSSGRPPRAPGKESTVPDDREASEEEMEVSESGSKRHRPETTASSDLPLRKKPRLSLPEETTNWDFAVWHRVWTGRRRVRRQLRLGVSTSDSLELERKVSETIVRHEGSERPRQPLLRFRVRAEASGAGRVLLHLVPASPGPLFQDFFHFLQNFLPSAVRKHLNQQLLGTPDPGGDEEGSAS